MFQPYDIAKSLEKLEVIRDRRYNAHPGEEGSHMPMARPSDRGIKMPAPDRKAETWRDRPALF